MNNDKKLPQIIHRYKAVISIINLCVLTTTSLFVSLTSRPIYAQQTSEMTLPAIITNVSDQTLTPYDESQQILQQTVFVLFTSGTLKGETRQVEVNRLVSQSEQIYKVGERVLVSLNRDITGQEISYIIDYVRTPQIMRYALLFVLIVLLVARKKGIQSLLGLAASFVIIFYFTLPGIQAGYSPILISLISALGIMLFTFFVAHGFSKKTLIAVIGTSITLLMVAILAVVMINDFRLDGFASEEAAFLQFLKQGEINIKGLLLAGIIISVLGVLDDITISQASIVNELKRSNPQKKPWQIYHQAMNVGRDHIASLVNTLILVYVGASLPLTLLFMLDESRSFMTVLNYGMIAEEVAKTLVASIGLVLAVPITTLLASYYLPPTKHKDSHASHHH